jgi:ketosteroid isomerase-like protein
MSMTAIEVVRRYWALMASNNFKSVGAVLSDEYTLDWPQSGERIRGKHNFARMNEEYPANGPWQFTVNRILGNDSEVVTDVSVTDGVQRARVISFFTIANGKIDRQVEFWPEPYPAPENRTHLVERIEQ